jgi:hypothetical protein
MTAVADRIQHTQPPRRRDPGAEQQNEVPARAAGSGPVHQHRLPAHLPQPQRGSDARDPQPHDQGPPMLGHVRHLDPFPSCSAPPYPTQ